MSTLSATRVRFAPAPTGMMHLGNVRTALMNYLVAQQKQGTFILRIEDTDAERNFDPGAVKIQEDLTWLSLFWDEGAGKGGPHAPYYQSERTAIYQETLQKLIPTIELHVNNYIDVKLKEEIPLLYVLILLVIQEIRHRYFLTDLYWKSK